MNIAFIFFLIFTPIEGTPANPNDQSPQNSEVIRYGGTLLESSAPTIINRFGICKTVDNNSGQSVFVPHRSQQEWESFVARPPTNVAISGCGTYQYSVWSAATACSATCGGGTATRTRTCKEMPANVNVDCALCGGVCTESTACNQAACFSYSNWSSWGACSRDCGTGSRTRSRQCLNHSGTSVACASCGGVCSETQNCNTQACLPECGTFNLTDQCLCVAHNPPPYYTSDRPVRYSGPLSGVMGVPCIRGRASYRGCTAETAQCCASYYQCKIDCSRGGCGGNIKSDLMTKKDILPLNGLEIVEKLKGVQFRYIVGDDFHYGVIAQDVQKVMPHAVAEDAKGIKSVYYTELIAPLIEATKTLSKENKILRREVDHLKTQVDVLNKKITAETQLKHQN